MLKTNRTVDPIQITGDFDLNTSEYALTEVNDKLFAAVWGPEFQEMNDSEKFALLSEVAKLAGSMAVSLVVTGKTEPRPEGF